MKPDRPIQWPRAVLVACALVAMLLSCPGCGASAVKSHARAAIATRASLDVAAAGIEAPCDVATVRASSDPQRRATRCLHAARAHDMARVAWQAWADGVLLALDGELSAGDLVPLAIGLLPHLPTLIEAGEWWGFDLDLPDMLTGGE